VFVVAVVQRNVRWTARFSSCSLRLMISYSVGELHMFEQQKCAGKMLCLVTFDVVELVLFSHVWDAHL
jgi:hypothetical protein